jgi:antitoxin ParD1/3/4
LFSDGRRLIESAETKLETLRHLLNEGEQSGIADYDYDEFIASLVMQQSHG